MSSSSLQSHVVQVCDLIKTRVAADKPRAIVAIAGPPASGKSTLAETVVRKINSEGGTDYPQASLVPMDGYHLHNRILNSRGLLARKGAPETFDAYGFCEAIKQLSSSGRDLFFPEFDRHLDTAIANSIVIHPQTPLVVVEGNYLLLRSTPWSSLKEIFTATVFLCPSLDVLQNRLQQRWITHGLDPESAESKVTGNDLPNARLVLNESREADLILSQVP